MKVVASHIHNKKLHTKKKDWTEIFKWRIITVKWKANTKSKFRNSREGLKWNEETGINV